MSKRKNTASTPASKVTPKPAPKPTPAPAAPAAPATGSSSGAERNRRSRTEERRKERQQQQRRQQILIFGAVLVVVAFMAAIALIVNSTPAEAPIPAGVVERYSDIPTSLNDQGYPILGNPQEAVVRVEEYSSFSCPNCRTFHEDLMDTIIQRVKAGDITFTYVPMGQYGELGGVDAAKAALCVQEQGRFWPYHDVLFNWQGLYGIQAFTPNRLRAGVEGLGLDVDSYNTCMSSGRPDTVLDRADRQGRALEGFNGTPTLTINGVMQTARTADELNAAIDDVLQRLGVNNQAVVTEEPTVAPTDTTVPTATRKATEAPTATDESTATDEPAATSEVTATISQ